MPRKSGYATRQTQFGAWRGVAWRGVAWRVDLLDPAVSGLGQSQLNSALLRTALSHLLGFNYICFELIMIRLVCHTNM